MFIPEADAIWYQGFSYARGTIEMNLSSCGDANGCVERLIARLGFEDYLLGLGEVPASWPMEAMRAQAVAARTYAAYDVQHYPMPRGLQLRPHRRLLGPDLHRLQPRGAAATAIGGCKAVRSTAR